MKKLSVKKTFLRKILKFFDNWEIREYVELQSLGKKKKKNEKNEKEIKIRKSKKKKKYRDKNNYENGIRKKQ